MRAVWAAMVAAALTGCVVDKNHDGLPDGQRDPTKVIQQGPSTPGGSVSGQVLGSDLNGLSGVTVTVTLPSDTPSSNGAGAPLTATTDSRGFWAVTGVPGNSQVLATFSKDGYTRLSTPVNVPGQVATQPLSNGNGFAGRWILSQLNGTVTFRVLDATGRPAKGAHATLNVNPTAYVASNFTRDPAAGNSAVVAETTADDNGLLTFTNVPSPQEIYRIASAGGDSSYEVVVSALDQTGDGVPDSGGVTAFFTANDLYLLQADTTLHMPDPRAGARPAFSLVSSNVGSLWGHPAPADNLVKPSDALNFVFSHAVQPPSVTVRITDETGTKPVSTGAPVISSGQIVAIQPTAALENGKEYNVAIHAVSAETGAVIDLVGYFFGGDATSAFAPDLVSVTFRDTGNGAGGSPDGKLNPGEWVEVTFNQPMGYYGRLATAALPPQVAYFDADLDSNGSVGNTNGELGYGGVGFDFVSFEPVTDPGTQFRLMKSGYTTRFLINFLGPGSVNPGTAVNIALDRLSGDSTTGLEGLWGQGFRKSLTKPLAFASP